MSDTNNTDENNEKEEQISRYFIIIITFLAFGIVLYLFYRYWNYLPHPDLTDKNLPDKIKDLLSATGTFGDSFGVLTCLFSGLSSAGMIVAIFMQREELKLQRKELADNRVVLKQQKGEFEKTAKAQENSVKLSALMTILREDEKLIEQNIKDIDSAINTENLLTCGAVFEDNDNFVNKIRTAGDKASITIETIKERKTIILSEIEKIIIESGVKLPSLP